jgi:hypothetical protein
MMGIMKVCVIEPPFIEPGMPYPEIHRIAHAIELCGHEAIAADANIMLYRSVIDTPINIEDKDVLYGSFANAFFVDDISLLYQQGKSDKGSLGDMSPDLVSALRNFDTEKLDRLKNESLKRFSGLGDYVGHFQYVSDQELLNAFLDYNIKACATDSYLSLNSFENGIDITSPDDIFDYITGQTNSLIQLFEKHLQSRFAQTDCNRVLIVVREQVQLLPGFALAHWMKSCLAFSVSITGDFLNLALRRHFPGAVFQCTDEVIMGKIDSSLEQWLSNKSSALILRVPPELAENSTCNSSNKNLLVPGFVPQISTEEYFSPYPLTGSVISSKCYWSKCRFCGVSCIDTHNFSYLAIAALHRMLKKNIEKYNIHHVQFLDYAIPPAICKKIHILHDLEIRWAGQCRFEKQFTDPNLLNSMYRAGCTSLTWGFESGSPLLLSSAGKGGTISNESRSDIIKNSFLAGISNHLFVICGLPGETNQDFMETVKFIEKNNKYIAGIEVYLFQLVPGTSYYSAGRENYNAKVEESNNWNFNIKGAAGNPEMKTAVDRVDYLNNKFSYLSVKSQTHDFIEGDLAMIRTFQGN